MMLLYRTILLLVGGGGLIVGILLVFILTQTWSNSDRLEPIAQHIGFYLRLQQASDELAASLPPDTTSVVDRRSLAATLGKLAEHPDALAAGTDTRLRQAAARLRTADPTAPLAVHGSLAGVLDQEGKAHRVLLDELQRDNWHEFQAALALAVVLPVLTIALLIFFHRRVLAPVYDLSDLLGLLARRDYTVVATDRVDPVVRPLFDQYNRMVKRLHDLEQGHQKREDSLRQDVDQATWALFQQQAELGRMERLAAVGEVSARLGHELRNPLSGVLMALTNLREEIDSEDQDQRLGLAIGELERISHLLTRVVEESRQVPERPRKLCLRTVVDQLVGLVRYQLDDRILVETEVPDDLYCILPESGFRHAILNLVLNAAQAMDHHQGGTVRITAERQADAVEISIRDDGPGFPEELLHAGVHEFGSWRRGGTGLGLATVRRFVFANSGRLQLSNPDGGGACATLVFPLEQNAA